MKNMKLLISGRQYDGHGNAQPWWSESTIEAFTTQVSILLSYSVFHRFREAKFGNDGSILSSSQFSLLP